MTLNILFPVLNEHIRLEKGIEGCVQFARENIKIPYTLTIVDNGSDDDTPDIARRLEEKYECVEYVRLEQRGVGIAFKYGIENTKADIVGYMDIDLSTDLEYLTKTIEMFENNQEIEYVNGSRFHKKSDTKGRKWYRNIISHVLVVMLKCYLGMKATDALCGFTFLRSDVARKLVSCCSDDHGWFYTVEFLIRAERMGINIYDMPVAWQEDYNTTVNVRKTTMNYLKQMSALKKRFRAERRENDQAN